MTTANTEKSQREKMDLQVRALAGELQTHIQPNEGGRSSVLGLCDTANGPGRAGAVKQSALDAATVSCPDTAIKGSLHGRNRELVGLVEVRACCCLQSSRRPHLELLLFPLQLSFEIDEAHGFCC